MFRPFPLQRPHNERAAQWPKGSFVIFRSKSWHHKKWKKELYVGNIYDEYDAENDYTAIHHYSDLGKKDNLNEDLEKPLQERVLRPLHKDEFGKSFTDAARISSKTTPAVNDYHCDEFEVLVGNFFLQGTKVPRKVAVTAYEELAKLEEQDRRNSRPGTRKKKKRS